MLYDHSRTLNIIRLKISVNTKRTFRRDNESYQNINKKNYIAK